MKKLLTILLLASMSFTFASCDSYLDVNKEVDAPEYVTEDLYLAGILSALGQGNYYDVRATSVLTQSFGNYDDYSSYASNFYVKASDSAGEMWRVTYWLLGMNLENMINQSLEHKSYKLAGIGYAIKAFSWDMLTKLHGEVPMKEAFIIGKLSHSYDYQDEVYTQIRDWAEKAIEYLEMEDNTDYTATQVAKADLMYAGSAAKWIKFAHAVIVRNLSSLTNKNNFVADYYQDLVDHAALAIATNSDNAVVKREGGAGSAKYSSYNNCWGVHRGVGTDEFYQHDFAVQVMTGTMPEYDKATGNKKQADKDPVSGEVSEIFPFVLAQKQYVTDTSDVKGHFDPRVTAKLATVDANYYSHMTDEKAIKGWIYYGGSFTSNSGPISDAPNLWGSQVKENSKASYDGTGRWLYRNDAPYVLMTASEMQFCLAEAHWKKGDKAAALAAFKKGIALDLEFTESYLKAGAPKVTETDAEGNPKTYAKYGDLPGGDVIAKATFNKLANEYKEGPYVNKMTETDLTLSHIMLQKFVALYPWGSSETWVDMRKYHYDMKFNGDVPTLGDGIELTHVAHKWDDDDTKVYKGFYLAPSQVQNRRGTYNIENSGSPCYRLRPRYNSEYMWNIPSLNKLKPIAGTAVNYQCSIPWFAYPGDMPKN